MHSLCGVGWSVCGVPRITSLINQNKMMRELSVEHPERCHLWSVQSIILVYSRQNAARSMVRAEHAMPGTAGTWLVEPEAWSEKGAASG